MGKGRGNRIQTVDKRLEALQRRLFRGMPQTAEGLGKLLILQFDPYGDASIHRFTSLLGVFG